MYVPVDLPVRPLRAHVPTTPDPPSIARRTPSVEIPAASTFTAEQEQAAARRRGPLLLAAGAGSGKTSVLVERFVRAVREDGIAPARILAITFTERAAAELRERVRARLLELGEREAARDTEGAPIGTFHGFCARLLRIHALTAGLDPEFAILDEAGAGRLRQLAFRRALATLLAEAGRHSPSALIPRSASIPVSASERRQGTVELLAAYGADRVQRMVLGVYAEQRSRGVSRPALPDWLMSEHSEPAPPPMQPSLFDVELLPHRDTVAEDPLELEAFQACALLGEILVEFGDGYAALKHARPSPSGCVPALDFDDLKLCARDLLERHKGVRGAWSERIELLMVDEFQDTNRRQLALLELLERDNLFTVGDELQSIYGFRHAEVEIFRERRRALHAKGAAIALAHNFRSRPPLIAAVNGIFGERFGDAYTPLIAARDERSERRHGRRDRAAAHREERLGGVASRPAHRRGAAAGDPLASGRSAPAGATGRRARRRRAGGGRGCGGAAARCHRSACV